MLWPDEKREPICRRPCANDLSRRRMRCIRGAYAASVDARRGRVPGAEGRAVIEANRQARKRDREKGEQWWVDHTLASQCPFSDQ